MRVLPKHPLEALLRPPYELMSATSIGLLTFIVATFPQFFLLSPSTKWLVVIGLSLATGWRVWQGVFLLRYRRNLAGVAPWHLSFDRLPRSAGKLYLGRGFLWTSSHSQRLKETQTPKGRRYLNKAMALPTKALEDHGRTSGRPEIHGVELREESVWMSLSDRVGHTLVLGTTRVGKTRLAELLIAQDIHRGDVVIVFDPKGDLDLLFRIIAEARRVDRLTDVVVFHLGYPKRSCRYNAIGRFSRITEVATRIANQLPDGGNSAAFKEFAWRFVNIIAGALVALQQTPNYRKVRHYINDIEPLFIEYTRAFLHKHGTKGWSKEVKAKVDQLNPRQLPAALRGRNPEAIALLLYIQEKAIYDPVLDGLVSAYKYDRTYFDKIVSSVGPLMEKLTTGAIADLISPDEQESVDPRPIFDWLDVIRQRKIVYVGLDSLSDVTVAGAIGNSMFADLVSVAGHIYKFGIDDNQSRPRISLHADEFNELIGDEFVPLLNKAGGAGFQVTAYTQTWSDIKAQLQDTAKAGQVAGNFNTMIMLRVRELATADMMIDQLPRVALLGKSTSSAASDKSGSSSELDFETSHADSLGKSDAPLLTTAELFTLPRGQAFALLDGGSLWKLRIPLPQAKDQLLPSSINEALDTIGQCHGVGTGVYETSDCEERIAETRSEETKTTNSLPPLLE